MWSFAVAAVAEIVVITVYLVLRGRRPRAQRNDTARWPRLGERMSYGSLLASAVGTTVGFALVQPHTEILLLGLGGLLLPTVAAQALSAMITSRRLPSALALVGGFTAGITNWPH